MSNTLAYNSLWQVRNDSWCSLEEAGQTNRIGPPVRRQLDQNWPKVLSEHTCPLEEPRNRRAGLLQTL